MKDVVDGDRFERRRWCSRLREISPEGKGKEREMGRLISKVLIAHRFKENATMKLNFNPPTMTLTRAFFARPRGGRHSHAPGGAPDVSRPVHRWDEDVMVETILSEWWRSPRRVAN